MVLAYTAHGQAQKSKGFRRRAQSSQSREEGLQTVLIGRRMPSGASCPERGVGTEARPPLGPWRGFGLPVRPLGAQHTEVVLGQASPGSSSEGEHLRLHPRPVDPEPAFTQLPV